MKTRTILIVALIVVVLAAVAAVVYVAGNPVETTLDFQVRDAVSKEWVWDSTIHLQNRLIRGYFQSDRGPITYTFTHLEPGEAELTVSAPAYVEQSIPVTLKKGRNALESPIDMVGYEIPGLDHFIIFEDYEGNDIVQEIRPVSKDGPAVLNHPCLDLWIGARMSVQIMNGIPVQEPTEEGSERGEQLFRGEIKWEWDAQPETTFRYSARIPGARIKANPAPLRVIDYLIIVPDPRRTSRQEIEEIMDKAYALDPVVIQDFLKPYEDQGKFSVYQFTSWNVKKGASS